MSVYSRPDSPVWNVEFEIAKKRYRKPTPYPLDRTPSGVIFKGPQYKNALVWEVDQKKAVHEAIRNGGIDSKPEPAEPTLRKMCETYIAECGDDLTNRDNIETSLKMIADYFEKEKGVLYLSQVTDTKVNDLVQWRRQHKRWDRQHEKRISNATVNRSTVKALQPVFTWAKDKQEMKFPQEPNWKKHVLDEPKSRPRELRESEETALEAVFDPDYNEWRRFALCSGLRMGNTLLRWKDYDPDRGMVRLIGKGNKVLEIVLSPEAISIIEGRRGHHDVYVFTFVAQRTRSFVKQDGTVQKFISGRRYPISYWGAQTYWRRRRDEAAEACPSLLSDDKRLSFRMHDHRHTLGTRLYRKYKDLGVVKDALGHASIVTSQKYAHVTPDEMRQKLADVEADYKRERKVS